MTGRILQTKIWQDDFFWALTVPEKLLFIYFLNNEAITILNLYEVPDRKIAYDTGVDMETLINAKRKFESAGKLSFFKDFIYINNAHRYQFFKGKKNEAAARNIINRLPKDVLDWFLNLSDTPIILHRYHLDTSSNTNTNTNTNTNPIHKPFNSDDDSVNPDDIPENLGEMN